MSKVLKEGKETLFPPPTKAKTEKQEQERGKIKNQRRKMTLFSPNMSITTSNINGLIYQLKDTLSDVREKSSTPLYSTHKKFTSNITT